MHVFEGGLHVRKTPASGHGRGDEEGGPGMEGSLSSGVFSDDALNPAWLWDSLHSVYTVHIPDPSIFYKMVPRCTIYTPLLGKTKNCIPKSDGVVHGVCPGPHFLVF